MDVSSLPYSLDITSTSGATLSTEEMFVVQNSLLLLQRENHFTRIYFWGKIFGIEKDYYVAFGYTESAKRRRVFYYSTNQRDWALLNGPTQRALTLFSKVNERFQGDPCYVLDCRQVISSTSGDSNCAGLIGLSQGTEFHLKEEDRLAAVVKAVCEDCAVAPRGAFFKNCSEVNPVFQGLGPDEGTDLQSWMHIKEGDAKIWQPCNSSSSRTGGSGDSEQYLKGKWSVRVRAQGSVCLLRSLLWLGFTAYHRLRTPDHGFVYFGDGIKAINMYGLADEDNGKQQTTADNIGEQATAIS